MEHIYIPLLSLSFSLSFDPLVIFAKTKQIWAGFFNYYVISQEGLFLSLSLSLYILPSSSRYTTTTTEIRRLLLLYEMPDCNNNNNKDFWILHLSLSQMRVFAGAGRKEMVPEFLF